MVVSYTFNYICYEYNFFFFNDTATTEIYTLSLHDALPISARWLYSQRNVMYWLGIQSNVPTYPKPCTDPRDSDRKSTRLNSSHLVISYAVFCLKKKRDEYHYTYKTGSKYDCSRLL